MNPFAMLRHLLSGPFIRAVGVLVGGTAVAQAILAATLPISTRLYTPEDFSALAVFVSIISILSVATCLRYDIAVPLPEEEADGVAIVLLALGIAGAINAALLAVALAAPDALAQIIGHPELAAYLWLVPLATFLAGAYSTLQFWFVRSKRFGDLARNRIAQAAGSSATQVGAGLVGAAPLGLLLGQVVNSGLGAVRLGLRFHREQASAVAATSSTRIAQVARAYGRFPKYSALEAMFNSAAIYLPIVLLSAWAVGPEAGYISLGMYAMQVPMGMIGNAVSQVYMSRGPEESRTGNLGPFTVEVLSGLLKTGVGPIIFIGIVAPELFRLVFGNDWVRAGVLVGWMTPWFVLQFLASPVSLALHITNRLAEALLFQLFGLMIRTGSVFVAAALPGAPLSEGYALSGLLFYLVYLLLIIHAVGTKLSAVARATLRNLPIIVTWCIIGYAARSGLSYIHL